MSSVDVEHSPSGARAGAGNAGSSAEQMPLIVIGTAGMIRVLRPTLLDELPKQFASAWRMSSQAVRWWDGIQWRGGGAGCWRRALA